MTDVTPPASTLETPTLPGLRGIPLAPAPTTKAARRIWLRARKNGLGASDIAGILGLSPWPESTPMAIWLDKTDPELDNTSTREVMQWGLRLERAIADEFRVRHARQLGVRVASSPGLLRHKEYPWLLATPDRILVSLATKVALAPLEIKTAGHYAAKDWWNPETHAYDLVPLNYQVQLQVQMEVLGLPYALIVPLLGGQRMPDPIRVDRDEEVIAQIIKLAGAWWEAHVVKRVMPEPTVVDLPRLPEVWPGDGSTVTADDTLVAKLLIRERMRTRMAQLKKAIDRADLDAKKRMQDATMLVDQDGNPVATWTRFEKHPLNLERFRTEQPAMAARYTATESSQRFTVKVRPPQRSTS